MCDKAAIEQPIELEYKKTGINPDEIALLRRWVNTQPHLPWRYISDLDLLLCYYSCYGSTAVTKQVLDLHFTLKTHFTNFFKDRVVDQNIIRALKTVLIMPLETLSYDGYTVVYHRLIDTDAKNFVYQHITKAALMLMDVKQYELGTAPGIILVVDMVGVTLSHIGKLDLLTLQQFLYFLQEALLVRLKGIHFMNAPSFVDKLLMLMRPFLKKELMDILHIHQVGSKGIEKYFPLEALPKESGGQYLSMSEVVQSNIEKLQVNTRFFEEEAKKRVTESERPGKPKSINDIFGGVEGSFKKLEID
ncbi:alpha-tocopherol transfer protein-like [Zerene cesonia]|uniref:alpha-tocopherol transfer protein-like n=1 Tax=Zerene cesonia TaxID=33412 RepID=UPI0018E503BC|nr:alpha-tocopherol transfer protein-like [Zerene cesonia]